MIVAMNTLFDPENIFSNSVNELVNEPFIELEISSIIKKLRNNKSCDIDNIICISEKMSTPSCNVNC
jgi:hypothetical protein